MRTSESGSRKISGRNLFVTDSSHPHTYNKPQKWGFIVTRVIGKIATIELWYTHYMQNKPPRETDSPEEMLDLVDENDNVIGSKSRKEIYAEGLRNYRVVHAFIVNSKGKIWIPRRVSTKKLYPDGLDYSIAGHVESGETYEEGMIKEAIEEVDIDLKTTPFEEIASFNPHTHEVHCFQKVYVINSDTVPNYNKEDFSGYEWLSPEEIVKRFEEGESGKEDIPEVVRLCFLQ